MYLDYWNLKKHPFNNVPDPDMYFNAHNTVDEAVGQILFAVEEADECLAVVVGPVGVGKTMSLRIALDALDNEKYRIAFVTNPDMTFPQILREIVGQLQGKECEEKRKDKLLERFNRVLFETSDQNKRVVIFIDEGNVIKPHNLESLRLLTNMQDDHQNLFTIVLAGQPELARRLEAPGRANLFQRIGVYCKIENINSRETMKDYIEHRLERAGLSGNSMFTEKAYDALWEVSENGIPRLVNKICKLSLKAAQTNRIEKIDEDIVSAVSARFQRSYRKTAGKTRQPVPVKAKGDNIKVIQKKPAASLQGAEVMCREECEKLANQLATERINRMTKILDPFDAWIKARNEILQEMERIYKAQPAFRHAG
jgi:type II secretory pathway predicted ATPase ExeA